MHIASIMKLSLLTFATLSFAVPTPVTTPMGAAVEYARAAQDVPVNLVELSNKRDGPIDLIQLPEKRDGPIDLIQLPKRDSPVNLVQLPKKRQDSPINLVELSNRETTKYRSVRSCNPQDAPINLIQLTEKRQDSPVNFVELSNRAETELLAARQNDCGSSPYQNQECNAGTGLSIPAFAVIAMALCAIMIV
ncbi:uncharacterized protein EAF01_009255 [Botrytis porri]|uniref:Ubiquitin 3 binding protein But2 C-terminal domain-containing protein n=1 Tax=Botrytis porri TaxID=87229 RepID=A0A4Z1L4U5_9HELO|nr:uncharacterized protein EAF01_009255 [Botrytis porri]KAF7896852.1 hypothetical protein EAF01_009255 [Botrytis porri]TGO91861.1 hypothetical protein BPOR_0016g00080 [Botrytis porri]